MSNTFASTDLIEKIVAGTLDTLRESAIMPAIVNTDFSKDVGRKGQVINVDISPAQTATDVTAAMSLPAFSDSTGLTRPITIDKQKKANFHLTSKEMAEINDGLFKQGRMHEAIRAVVNQINTDVMSVAYKATPFAVGTAATAPFASNFNICADAVTQLDKYGVSGVNRSYVFDSAAQANFLKLTTVNQYQTAGSTDLLTMKKYMPLFGAQPYFDAFVAQHTAGTAAGTLIHGTTVGAVGGNTIYLRDSGSGTLVAGDIVRITTAGTVYNYVVTANVSLTNAAGGVAVSVTSGDSRDGTVPVLHVAADVWTVQASHRASLLLQRDAVGFVTRPENLASTDVDFTQTVADSLSGAIVQISHYKGYHQEGWEVSALYGIGSLRPNSSVRIMG